MSARRKGPPPDPRPLVVAPGEPAASPPRPGVGRWPGLRRPPEDELEARARRRSGAASTELSDAQELLWASDSYAVLVVLQAMDAAGKDSAIEHVMSGVNPQGVQVVSFKTALVEELDHNFLWRIRRRCPSAGGSASSTARTTRRSSRSRCTPSGSSRSASRPATRDERVLAGAIRGHQRLRAPPRPQRHADRQVLPPRLEGGTEASGSSRGSTRPARSGSSTPPTWPNARTGTTT